MIISPARFEDEYNAIPKAPADAWVDLTNSVAVQPELWDLICNTLDSLGYGATVKKLREEIK